MAYQNAFTIGTCTLKVFKEFDAGFPLVGYAEMSPAEIVSEGLTFTETAGSITIEAAAGSSAAYIFAVLPEYVVDGLATRITVDGPGSGTTWQYNPATAIKTDGAAGLTFNQSSLVLAGVANETNPFSFSVPDADLEASPNPAELSAAIDWLEVGLFVNSDGPLNGTLVFTVEIDAAAAPACFWQDVVGATQNCTP